MKIQNRFWHKSWLVMIALVALLGLGWNVALGAPPSPEIEISPGYEQEITAGDTAAYYHVVTNTGNVTGAITIVPAIPTGWEIEYTTAAYPQGTTVWMPITLSKGATLPLTISLTAPSSARSGLYTSTITVTLLSSPPYNVVIYELTRIRIHHVYLPLVLRAYAPFVNGSFEADLAGWTPSASPLPVNPVNAAAERTGGTTPPKDGVRALLLGNPDYACNGVPKGFAAVQQTFVVPPDATTLKFEYIVWSQDASPDQRYDRFEVYMWKASLAKPKTPIYADGNQNNQGLSCNMWWRVPDSGWKSGSLDLAAHRGEMITVSFENHSRYDTWYNTYTYLDNVRIE